MRIALIYNDVSVTTILSDILRGEGHEVRVFSDGSSVREVIIASADVVICGALLPDASGEELLQMATRRQPYLASRFIFIDNSASDPAAVEWLAGRREVSIPIHLDELLLHIEEITTLC